MHILGLILTSFVSASRIKEFVYQKFCFMVLFQDTSKAYIPKWISTYPQPLKKQNQKTQKV